MQPESTRRIARERITKLFDEAEKRPDFARRYVMLAKKIGMRYNVRIPKDLKRKYCKYCYAFFRPGNFTQRVREKRIIIKCNSCGKVRRLKI